MFCTNCGFSINDFAKFCEECGEPRGDDFSNTTREEAEAPKPSAAPRKAGKLTASLVPARLQKEVLAGAVVMLISVPFEFIYGAIALAPLGPIYSKIGAQAALWSCVLSGVLAFLLRATPTMISGTRASVAFVLATLVTSLMAQPEIVASKNSAETILVLIFLCSALAGLIQFLFGLVKLGRVLQFIPYPVMSGLMAGVAVLMVLAGVRPAFGVPGGTPWEAFFDAWHPLSAVVMLATFAICLRPPKILQKVPALVSALVLGSILHHLLALMVGNSNLGGMATTVDGLLPHYAIWEHATLKDAPRLLAWLPTLFPFALIIAALASLDTLIALNMIKAGTHTYPNGDQELRTQGLTMLATGLLGGTPCVGTPARVAVVLGVGARGRLNGPVYGLLMAVTIIFAGAAITLIPQSVMAGLLIFFGYLMIDDGTHRLLQQLLFPREDVRGLQYKRLLVNFGVVLTVALVVVFGDMIKAAGVGVVMAVLLFFMTNIKPVMRRRLTGITHRSLRVRSMDASTVLDREGAQITMLEMEGSLFFGTAERLSSEVQTMNKRTSVLILDLKRVRDIDATGARVLLQIARSTKAQECDLLLAGATPMVESVLRSSGMPDAVPEHHWFDDSDQAFEAAEDHVLARSGIKVAHTSLALGQTMLAHGLTAEHVQVLSTYLKTREFTGRSFLFYQSDAGDSLFVAADGVVDIVLLLANKRQRRITSFAPGVIFGELALLDSKPRSATASIPATTQVWELTRANFDRIALEHPVIANQLLLNLSLSLSERLRNRTREIQAGID
jgi:SulP family sulfate permease